MLIPNDIKEPLYLNVKLYTRLHVSRVLARHVRAAAFKIFIVFGAQTAMYNDINTPEQNPIYADGKSVNSSPRTDPVSEPNVCPTCVPACHVGKRVHTRALEHGETIFVPQESKTPACELRGDWYIAISSRKYERARKSPPPRLICKRPH